MKKRRWDFEILAILAVAALLSWFVQEPTKDVGVAQDPEAALIESDIAEMRQQWGTHYRMAQQFLVEGELNAAERELLNAEKIALYLPAGDKSLAETLDDLGQVYFRLEKPELAMKFQGRAVAALLLAGGPQDPELELFIERHGWARAEFNKANNGKATLVAGAPWEFLLANPPAVSKQRLSKELDMLESAYQKMENAGALSVIAMLRKSEAK